MEVLDRTLAPDYRTVEEVSVSPIASRRLTNGQMAYWVRAGGQPVVRLECIFDAGAWYEAMPGVSTLAMKMLAEGTSTRTSAAISAYFDRYGAFLETHSGTDRTSLTVYCLTKYLPQILPLFCELIADSAIPEKELNDQKNLTRQSLRVNLEKNNYVAGMVIREKVFGATHPYGHCQSLETLDAIDTPTIQTFYQRHIRNRPFRLLLAGEVTESDVDLLDQYLGQLAVEASTAPTRTPERMTTPERAILIEREDSLQSSIRMGRPLFTRRHPDYFPMLVLNEVLGGYFGSRLMKNIREEKGFTYGIWSNVATFPREGYWVIGTDVKREFTVQTLEETRKEMRILREEPVPADELEVVKNYMAGSFVGSLNTPFEIADRYKGILFDGLPTDYLTTYIHRLRAVTAEQVQQMAQQYLREEDWIEVVVGNK